MSFHPACILPRRWTTVEALESVPAHLNVLQWLQTKSLVMALPFSGVLLLPTPIVTSDMLLWCLRHIFLMFYTPYSPRCVEKHILVADIIDGACDPARVKLTMTFASPRILWERTSRHIHTHSHTYVDAVGQFFIACFSRWQYPNGQTYSPKEKRKKKKKRLSNM